MEAEQGDWGFKALKQTVKLLSKLGRHEEMLAAYRRLLTYIKTAVTRNFSEKVIETRWWQWALGNTAPQPFKLKNKIKNGFTLHR